MAIAWRRSFTQFGWFPPDRASPAEAPTYRRVRRRTLGIDFLEDRRLLAGGVVVAGLDHYASPGETFALVVATYYQSADPLQDHVASAMIDWGDGTPVAGGQTGYQEENKIAAVHPYDHAGTYTVTTYMTVHGPDHPDYVEAAVSSFTVLSGLIFAGAIGPIYAHTGGTTAGDVLAGFVTDDGSAASTWHATIDWEDGSGTGPATISIEEYYYGMPTFGGEIVDFQAHPYRITSDHTFSKAGEYVAHVVLAGPDVSRAFDIPVVVADGPIYLHSVPKGDGAAGFGTRTTLAVAEFLDYDYAHPLTFTESVDWGDGSPRENLPFDLSWDTRQHYGSNHRVTTITGIHTYAAPGDYTATTTLRYADGSEATAATIVQIKRETVALAGSFVTTTTGNSRPFTILTGIDNVLSPFDEISGTYDNWLVSKTDWGDGSISTYYGVTYANVTSGLREFSVGGGHDYIHAGIYQVLTTVTSAAGAHAEALTTITVLPFVTLTNSLQATAGVPVAGVELALAGVRGQDPRPTDFHASIDWGDGTPAEAGTISAKTIADGSWTGFPGPRIVAVVLGSHTYRDAGTFAPKLTITGPDGTPLVVTTVATIAANPLTPAPAPQPVADPPVKTVAVAASPPKGHFVQIYRYGHPDEVRKSWVIDSVQQDHPGHRKSGHHRTHHMVNSG